MGGKIAMELAGSYPDLFSALIVLDISPLSYKNHPRGGLLNHSDILNALLSIDLSRYSSRNDIAEQLSIKLKNNELNSFLLKNLARKRDGNFYWRLNLNSLQNNIDNLHEGVSSDYYCTVPSLFIKAQNSNYILEQDEKAIKQYFKNVEIIEIEDANHWLHVSHAQQLIDEILAFTDKIKR